MKQYPDSPGFKAPGPSAEAAGAIAGTAKTLRAQVLRTVIRSDRGMTADEIAATLNRSILSVRPRVSELNRLGLIEKAPGRGKNESGMSATVWRVARPLPGERGAA